MGLTLRGTDIHDDNIHLEPDLSALVQTKGSDSLPVGSPGRFVRPRIVDRLVVPLLGFVRGTGQGREAMAESWRASTDVLLALLDPTLAPGDLVITPPLMGVLDVRTIEVRTLNAIHGRLIGGYYQSWTIELEAVDGLGWVASS